MTVPGRTLYGRPAFDTGATVHASYCLPCTEAELGETYGQIRDRATSRIQGLAKRKWRVTS